MAEVGARVRIEHHDGIVHARPAQPLVGHEGLQSPLDGRLGHVHVHVGLGDAPKSPTLAVRREEHVGAVDAADEGVGALGPPDLSRARRQRRRHVVRDVLRRHVWLNDDAERNVEALQEAEHAETIHFSANGSTSYTELRTIPIHKSAADMCVMR